MEHREYEELLTLEALGSLGASEKRVLEEHVTTCAACRTELAELRDAAGLLAHASTPAEPRAEVRDQILNAIRKESKPEASATVVPFQPRVTASRWPNLLRLAAAIAFIALLAGVFWRRDTRSLREITRLSEQINQQQQELSRQREALALLNSPGMKKMDLAGAQTVTTAQTGITARATFIFDPETGRAMLMTTGLPSAPPGMAYEVWFIPKGHSPMPGKTFTVDASGHAMMMDQVPMEARDNPTIAVTLEPKNGSPSPTGAIYLSS